MSEVQRSEIIYEEGWRETAPVITAQTPQDEEPPSAADPEEKPAVKRESARPLLITIQLILCLLAALVLFLLKAMDSEGYYDFMTFYREELQKPILSRDVFSAADPGRLFTGDEVTVQATPDEAADR